jgi:replicative DNA helicase
MNSQTGAAPAITQSWQLEATGPATLAQVMHQEELRVAQGQIGHLRPLPTGFEPLDDILNGGMRPGELLVIGGAFGVGKTIWGLQVARNAVLNDEGTVALFVCYEHDRSHLMSRLICLESAELGYGEQALTLRRLAKISFDSGEGLGPISRLREIGRYAPLVRRMESYADRLYLVKASGDHSTLGHVRRWVDEVAATKPDRMLLVVDYLQKVPVDWSTLQPETEVTTHLTQGLKELAMVKEIRIIAIAASDRTGLKSKRMRLSDLRGSSAVQYEADIGLILNNKYAIISREHLIYNPTESEAMRNFVVMSVEKNRAGRNAVDMEYALDAAHFRIVPDGSFVRERLVDEKVTLA